MTLLNDLSNGVLTCQSFPERNDAETTEDLWFSFRVRNQSPDVKPPPIPTASGDINYLNGFCIFRREADSLAKRRFGQKSLVIISQHSYNALFFKLLNFMTSDVLSDRTTLELACIHIANWDSPSIGRHELPFLGYVMDLEMYVTLNDLSDT